MQKKKYSLKRIVVVLISLVLATSIAQAAKSRKDHYYGRTPFEPTVTKEESRLLNVAMAVAATNTLQAVEILKIEGLEDASPAIDFAIGNLYFQAEKLDKAVDAYKASLNKMPKFRSSLMNLGRVYLLQNFPQKAIDVYQELVTDGQADADILMLLGHALLLENAPVSAESAYRQALLLSPKHSDAMLGLAKSLMLQERHAEGLALVGEILEGDQTSPELWALRSNAYLLMGKYAQAISTIEKARRLKCANSEMLATLGDLLLNKDQPQDALRAYKLAFQNNKPSVARILRAIDGFLMVGDPNSAEIMIKTADSILKKTPDLFEDEQTIKLLRLKAELAQQANRVSDAIKLCDEILRMDPLDAKTMLILAELQQDIGLLEDAVMTCERAARVKGYEADALVKQAQVEVRRERYDRAVPLLEAAQAFEHKPYVARYLDQIRRMID